MTLNFFTTEQGYQKSLIAPSSQTQEKRNYTTSPTTDSFKTERTTEQSEPTRRDDSDFKDIMRSLKKRIQTHRIQTHRISEARIDAATQDTRPITEADLRVFHTEQQDVVASTLNDIEPGIVLQDLKSENTQIDFANIAALKAEITRLLSEQDQAPKTETKTEATNILFAPESEAATNSEKVENILSLLSYFFFEDKETEETTTDNAFLSVLEKIQDIENAEEFISITSGLTPEQLTTLQDKIVKYMNDTLEQHDRDALEALAAQWVALVPPQTSPQPERVTKQKVELSVTDAPASTNEKPAAAPTLQDDHFSKTRYDARYDARYENTARDTTQPREQTDLKASDSTAKNTPIQNDKSLMQASGEQFLKMAGLSQGGGSTDTLGSQTITIATSQITNAPAQNALTNVITHAQSATHAHPATQMVSITIQKAVKAGEDTNIKLRLDPPDLGRVEVKMSIDKDNKTRLVLTAEKPETYTLLKQDADVLQRALSDSGLSSDGELSFELASDDHEFNQGRQNNSNSKSDAAGIEDETIIESRMDWSIDPETGRMRYDVLV